MTLADPLFFKPSLTRKVPIPVMHFTCFYTSIIRQIKEHYSLIYENYQIDFPILKRVNDSNCKLI